MKKRYIPAEIQIICLQTDDVLTVSTTIVTYDANEGQHDDTGWTS